MLSPALKTEISSSQDSAVNFEELLRKLDTEFKNLPASMLESFCFSFDGLNFDIRHIIMKEGHRFVFNATIGYLPFSIESTERREAIKTIAMASRALPKVRFTVDESSKISAGAFFDVDHIVAPDIIFYPLVVFMQEARPFIDLIGKYLFAPTSATQPKAAETATNIKSD